MSETEPKKLTNRNIALTLGIICIILIALIAYFSVTGISAQNSYNNLQNQNNQLQAWLEGNITGYTSQISSLQSSNSQLQTDYQNLQSLYNQLNTSFYQLNESYNQLHNQNQLLLSRLPPVHGANVKASWVMPSGANYNIMWWNIAKDIGINTFRLTLDVGGPYTVQELGDYLNIAGNYSIKTIVLVPQTGYPLDEVLSKSTLLPFLQAFEADSRILMWDIKNEPDVSQSSEITWLTDMSQWFHANDPTHPITIGGWHNSTKPNGGYQDAVGHCEDGKILVPLVDIYSPHFYLDNRPFSSLDTVASTDLALHKQYANGKPVLLQEYGYFNTNPINLANQRHFYETVLNDTRTFGYEGSCFWNLVPPSPFDSNIGSMSILFQNGTYTPTANYLKSLWNP